MSDWLWLMAELIQVSAVNIISVEGSGRNATRMKCRLLPLLPLNLMKLNGLPHE